MSCRGRRPSGRRWPPRGRPRGCGRSPRRRRRPARRSMRTTSGRMARHSTTASRPEPGADHLDRGLDVREETAMPTRIASWSSAISSRTRARRGGPRGVVELGQLRPHPRPPARGRLDLEGAAHEARPLGHPPQFPSRAAPRRAPPSRSNPSPSSCTSSVTPLAAYTILMRTERASAWCSAFVSALGDPEQGVGHLRPEGDGRAGDHETDGAASCPAGPGHGAPGPPPGERPASGEGASPSTLRRVSSSAKRGGGGGLPDRRPEPCRAARLERSLGGAQL